MTITRISVAELFATARDFSPEEQAVLDGLTDEEIERRALADPDAQPATPEMLRRGQENRQSRLRIEALRDASLGAKLSKAEPDLDLPVFEITDQNGRKVLLKASECRRVTATQKPAACILKLEAVVTKASSSKSDAKAVARARAPEKQAT